MLTAELAAVRGRIKQVEAEAETLRAQLGEAMRLVELQKADLDRYRAAYERFQPNKPERVPANQLQLAFERLLLAFKDTPEAQALRASEAAAQKEAPQPERSKKRHPHGRRRLDMTDLPVERVQIDPDEVVAVGGKGFVKIGEETSERLAFKPGGYVRLKIVRTKWVREEKKGTAIVLRPTVALAPIPDSVWPDFMADPSAIAQDIVAKYDDCLPLNRQEHISARNGFTVPRSTQCSWLSGAWWVLYRIVEAMFAEAKATAFCIATDATGAPVRIVGGCDNWHIFVLLADRDHVVFRYTYEHSSDAVKALFEGFHGHLLADAAPVYDVLYREYGIAEVGCWFHLRRPVWRAIRTEPERAFEALSLIGKLFEVERKTQPLTLPERTEARAAAARPVLALFEKWIEKNRDLVDPRGPLDEAIGYYENQKDALQRFLTDGRLRLDNSISEQQLRRVVLGRLNWMWFANETGLRWYTTFRSLIASCVLHGLNPQQYLEQVLRLAPHWPAMRTLELAPKYWRSTLEKLDPRQRATLQRPWERKWPTAPSTAPPATKAA